MEHSTLLLLLGFGLGCVGVSHAQCSFNTGDYILNWYYEPSRGNVHFHLNKYFTPDNSYTGVGFGYNMSNMDVILAKVENGFISLMDGYSLTHSAPAADNQNNVFVTSAQRTNGVLTVNFYRRLNTGDQYDMLLGGCVWFQHLTRGGNIFQGRPMKHTVPPIGQYVCNIINCRQSVYGNGGSDRVGRLIQPIVQPVVVNFNTGLLNSYRCLRQDEWWCADYVTFPGRTCYELYRWEDIYKCCNAAKMKGC